jgi:hypothetical protein
MPIPRNNELNEVNKLLESEIDDDISIVKEMVDNYEKLKGEEKTTEAIVKLREALEYCEKYKTICDKVKEAAGVTDEWNLTNDLLDKIHNGLGEKIRSGIPSLEDWQDALTDMQNVHPGDAEFYHKNNLKKAETSIKFLKKSIFKFMRYGTYYKDMISYLNEKLLLMEDYVARRHAATQAADMGDALVAPSAGRLTEDERKDAFYQGGGRKKRRTRRKTKRNKSKTKKSKKRKSKRKSKGMGKKKKYKKK